MSPSFFATNYIFTALQARWINVFVTTKCVSVLFKAVTDLSVHLRNTVLSKSFSHSSILCSLNYNIGLKSALDRGGGGGQVPDKHKQLAQAHTLVLGGGADKRVTPRRLPGARYCMYQGCRTPSDDCGSCGGWA